MIKNIVFDLGNVILMDKPINSLDCLNLDEKDYECIKINYFWKWKEMDEGNKTLKEHFLESDIPDYLKQDERILERATNYYKYRPFNEEVIDLIVKLRQNGYKIYVLSNNNHETFNYLLTTKLKDLIDDWVVSCEYHMGKPMPEFYNILFTKCNIKPEESFFIDDRPDNIATSESLGMKGHLFNYKEDGINKLIEDMRKNNINC